MHALQAGGQLDLTAEALAADTGGELRGQHLEDYGATEGSLPGNEHARHSASELPLQ